jgi:APA family basic amino acid/polyamine antiporter
VIGVAIYYAYSYRHSHVGRGIIEVPELAPEAPANVGIAPLPGAPVPPGERD